MSTTNAQLTGIAWQAFVVSITIIVLVALALLVALNAHWIARWLVKFERLLPGRGTLSAERRQTLQRLYASLITAFAIVALLIGVLQLFVDASQIIWIIGLFSAGFGLGARVLVADLIAGTTYIFSNTFAIGEKVEFSVGANKVDGVVEDVNMRSTLVRARSGELFTVPNGEIGVIRNFTRAPFSGAQVTLALPTEQLQRAMQILHELGVEAQTLFEEQIEPWNVLIVGESVDRLTEVTVQAKFAFGRAAELKPHMVALIHTRLVEEGILPAE